MLKEWTQSVVVAVVFLSIGVCSLFIAFNLAVVMFQYFYTISLLSIGIGIGCLFLVDSVRKLEH